MANIHEQVNVLIEVEAFKDVLVAGQKTKAVMSLKKPVGRVYLEGDTLHVVYGGSVTIPVRFTLSSKDGASYYPIGITFVRQKVTANEKLNLGMVNFPERLIRREGRLLFITDVYEDAPRTGIKYKFSLIIQRGSDGKIGIIDPGYTHDPM